MFGILSEAVNRRRQAASLPNRRVTSNHDSVAFRDMLTRLLHCHGRFDVHASDDVDDFETALSTLIDERYADGERDAGAILQHPACQSA